MPLYLLKNVTAGVFAGDCYDVTLRAEAGARVRVASASASRVCEMPDGEAESSLTIEAAAGSLVVYGPAPVILQAGADFRQSARICAAPGATVVFSEIVAFGRLASGERMAFRRFQNELTFMSAGDATPAYVERFTLSPADDAEAIDAALGGYGALGTLVYLGTDDDALAGYVRSSLPEMPGAYAGATALPSHRGVIVKVLASRPQAGFELLKAAEAAILSQLEYACVASGRSAG